MAMRRKRIDYGLISEGAAVRSRSFSAQSTRYRNRWIFHFFLICLASLIFSGIARAAESCLLDTSQSNFQQGLATSVLVLSSGDVVLAANESVDQQNTNLSPSGFTFHSYHWFGQTFKAGSSGPLRAVDVRLFCNGCTGTTPDITVSIRATQGGAPTGADLATATIPGFASAGGQYFKAIFPTPLNVNSGTTYAILVRSNANPSAGSYAYLVSAADPYSNGARLTSTTSGNAWSIREYDIGFRTYIGSGYVSNGNLVSSVKDSNPGAGGNPTWSRLSWGGDKPANTNLLFQAAGSNSSFGPFTFVGPDGSAGTYFNSSGANLNQFNGFRYLKYKAVLSNTNSSVSPLLRDVAVCHDNVTVSSADLQISNTNGASTSIPGNQTTYTIVASNAGPSSVSNATVTDTFHSNLQNCSWTCSGSAGGSCAASGSGNINQAVNLPSGGSTTFVASCGIKSSATGSLVNTATISSATADPVPGNNSATDSDTLGASADLSISVDDDASAVVAGSTVIYTIVAHNSGPSAVNNAVVVDNFPSKLENCEWMCDAGVGGSCSSAGVGNINQSVNLAANADVTFTAICDVEADATGSLVNTASISSAVTDFVPGNNTDTDTDSITLIADLGVSLNHGASAPVPGGTVNYTIVASNAGNSTADQATVSDFFPAQLNSCNWTCQGSAGGSCPASGNGNIITVVTLPKGSHVTYSVNCRVAPNASGSLVNMAEVSSGIDDPDPNNNQSMVSQSLSGEVIFSSGFD